MQRACSRKRIGSNDNFLAAVSDSESDRDDSNHLQSPKFLPGRVSSFSSDIGRFILPTSQPGTTSAYEETNAEDDGYFFGPIADSNMDDPETISLNSNSKKRDRDIKEPSKVSASLPRKSYSYTCLSSGNNYFVHKIPATPNELSRHFSMIKIHSSISLSSAHLPLPPQKKKLTVERVRRYSKNIIKRRGKRSHLRSAVKTQHKTAKGSLTEETKSTFSTLPDDIKVHIMTCLTASELRALMCTNFRNFSLCRSEHLWLAFCEKKWNLMQTLHEHDDEIHSFFDCHKTFQYHDDLTIPITPKLSRNKQPCVGCNSSSKLNEMLNDQDVDWDDLCPNHTNLSILLQLTQPYPAKVDDDFFSPKSSMIETMEATTNVPQELQTEAEFRTFNMESETNAYPTIREISVVQFTQTVGAGDRCIRSDVPFPPIQLSATRRFPQLGLFGHISRAKDRVMHSSKTCTTSSFHDILNRGKKFLTLTTIKPFVSPIVTKIEETERNGRTEQIYTMDVTPRLLAYFEVTLVPRDESQEPSPLALKPHQMQFNPSEFEVSGNPNASVSECVAVGLSTCYFHATGKMPGWDKHSFGFHGDDGGLFHSNGIMDRKFGPTFGVGDTVGCGINYANQGIFFTLNGRFLGYGWTGINLTEPLYPTIGIDSHHPVEINFGSSPFAFDTRVFAEQHLPLIDNALRDLSICGDIRK